jgi:hypothetical protein
MPGLEVYLTRHCFGCAEALRLAELAGTYRETATQTLDDFKRRGPVELGRKHIRILDRSRPEAIAEG